MLLIFLEYLRVKHTAEGEKEAEVCQCFGLITRAAPAELLFFTCQAGGADVASAFLLLKSFARDEKLAYASPRTS